MNIEVGDYIRLSDGRIGKVFSESFINKNSVALMSNKHIIFANFRDTDIKIKSHSKNLIDIIEVGDYINGYKVISINKEVPNNDYEGIELDRNNNYEYQFIAKNKVKTILTHEQYEKNCYKVEA